MKHLRFWFDPISPYAYLAFEHLPRALEGHSVEVSYQPVLLAGLLAHWGQKGPAEIAPKRDWTYRHVLWTAQHLGLPMQLPASHPFNPLSLLRLLLACAPTGHPPGRWACEQVLRHVWAEGAEASDADRLAALATRLAPVRDPAGAEVKAALRTATDEAVAHGVFGVPTVEVDGRLFWGLEGLTLLRAYLAGEPWFDGPGWTQAAGWPVGVQRHPGA